MVVLVQVDLREPYWRLTGGLLDLAKDHKQRNASRSGGWLETEGIVKSYVLCRHRYIIQEEKGGRRKREEGRGGEEKKSISQKTRLSIVVLSHVREKKRQIISLQSFPFPFPINSPSSRYRHFTATIEIGRS